MIMYGGNKFNWIFIYFLTKRNIRKCFCIFLLLMQNVLLFLKNERYKICIFFFKKRKKKQDISVVLLIKMYNNFVNFYVHGAPWILWGSVGMGMEGNFPPRRGSGTGMGKSLGSGAGNGETASAHSLPR
jgi:hypothetical protein